eukprot:Partr_v1_DN27158_c1_g1_i7_m16153 putative peroxisomal membrane protein
MQVFLEMSVRKFRGASRWRLIIAIETVKLLIRLRMFALSGNRMLLGSSSVPERDQSGDIGDSNAASGVEDLLSSPTLTSKDISRFLESRALAADFQFDPLNLVRPLLAPSLRTAEFLVIIKPLLYALLFHRYGRGSWTPWMLALAVDSISLHLYNSYSSASNWTFLERDELKRRVWQLSYYLLRGPAFTVVSKPFLEDFCRGLTKVPLVSAVGNIISEYVPLWERIFFYTSP